MKEYDVVLPAPVNVSLDVTDENLYSYELDNVLTANIQTVASHQLGKKIINVLTGHVADLRMAQQGFSKHGTEYVARFSAVAQDKLATGEWHLGIRKRDGATLGTIFDNTTGHIQEQVGLQERVVNELGSLPELAAMQAQLRAISEQITELTEVVQRVEQGQYNDRFAGVFSARQLVIEGLSVRDEAVKQEILIESVQVAAETTAKIMVTLRADIHRLVDANTKKKDVPQIEALVQQSLSYLNTAVQLRMAAYTALGEEQGILATLSNYRVFMKQSLLDTQAGNEHSAAWLIDNGHHGQDGQVLELTQNIYDQTASLIADVKDVQIGDETHDKIENMQDAGLPQRDSQ
jgi:hypothetical protein